MFKKRNRYARNWHTFISRKLKELRKQYPDAKTVQYASANSKSVYRALGLSWYGRRKYTIELSGHIGN